MNSFITFLNDNGLSIDKVYVDKFYHSISNNKWILVDNEVLVWIGYENAESKYNKKNYLEMLSSSFLKERDYKLLSIKEFNEKNKEELNILFTQKTTTNNRHTFLIVKPECFKESLLMLKTSKASSIRKYYLNLESYFFKYVKYTADIEIHKLKEELEEAKKNQNKLEVYYIDEYKPLSAETFIYVMTTKNYLSQNIFKIGHTKHLNERVRSYKTGRFAGDTMELVFSMKVVNSESAEKFIFSKLNLFKYKDNEMFHINYYMLMDIMNEFKRMEEENNKAINNIFSKYKPEEVKELNVSNLFEGIVREANENAGFLEKEYKPPAPVQFKKINESKNLTTDEINKTFESVNLCLNKEYTGKCEDAQEWGCLSILKHSFEASYSHAKREYLDNKKGCPLCRKHQIIDKIEWFVYDSKTYEYICKYDSYEDLKQNNIDILSIDQLKIIKNIVRESRWLTPVNDKIYSILSPVENSNKKMELNLNKVLSPKEEYVINILMKTKILGSKFKKVLAIDELNKKLYVNESMSKASINLKYVDTGCALNRKTISKYIDTKKNYAGYRFLNGDDELINEYRLKEDYEVINM